MKNQSETLSHKTAPAFSPVTVADANVVKEKKRARPSFKTVLPVVIIGLLLIAAITAGLLYYQTRQELRSLSTKQGQQEAAKKEIKTLVASLSKLTILPEEDPVIATILDEQALATQSAFYKDAQKGDKLLVFPNAQKAYIYSPSRNILVNSGPLILDQNSASAKDVSASPTPAADEVKQSFTIEVRNGSTTVGAGTKLKQSLAAAGYNVVAVNDASLKDYTSTQIFKRNSLVSSTTIDQLVKDSSGKVIPSLPDGEAATTADVLVIVGGQ
jgi:hypothetical protein